MAPFGGPGAVIPRGPLVVVRLLPVVGGEPQYSVLSKVDGHKRVVLEKQIRPVEEQEAGAGRACSTARQPTPVALVTPTADAKSRASISSHPTAVSLI